MLTFKNFEEEIPEDVLERGMDLCDANKVLKLAEGKPGNWTAVVSNCTVNLTVAGEKIKTSGCTCHNTKGAVCEHVAAVIYELYDYLDIDDDDEFDES